VISDKFAVCRNTGKEGTLRASDVNPESIHDHSFAGAGIIAQNPVCTRPLSIVVPRRNGVTSRRRKRIGANHA
jgi:hypothetical protein